MAGQYPKKKPSSKKPIMKARKKPAMKKKPKNNPRKSGY